MYETDEESNNDNMEGLEVISSDEDKTTTNNTNRKGSKIIPKKNSKSKSYARNMKKPQTRLSKKQV